MPPRVRISLLSFVLLLFHEGDFIPILREEKIGIHLDLSFNDTGNNYRLKAILIFYNKEIWKYS